MKVYFGKANLLSFINSAQDPSFSNCNILFKQKCNINFTFDKADIKDDESVRLWLTSFTDGVQGNVVWDATAECKPLQRVPIKEYSFEDLSSVYLVDNQNAEKLCAKGILIIGKPGEEIEQLSSLWFEDLQYTLNVFDELTSWDEIRKYASNCTDIILSDPYILKNEECIDNNLIKFLSVLLSNVQKARVNIVIFSEKSKEITPETFKDIKARIENSLKNQIAMKPNVVIVMANKSLLGEHDRCIVTNYKMFTSGDTFNYFESTGKKITKGRFFYVHSLVDKRNVDSAKKFLSHMQDVYDKVAALNNPELIYKSSNACSYYLNL